MFHALSSFIRPWFHLITGHGEHVCELYVLLIIIHVHVTCAGGSCRARVVMVLAKKFASPKDTCNHCNHIKQRNMQSAYSPVQVEHKRRVGGCDTPASSLSSIPSSIPIMKEELVMNSFIVIVRRTVEVSF